MYQGSGLLFQRLYNHWVAMTQAIGRPAGDKVEVFSPPVIPGLRPFTANQGHRNPLDRLKE